MDVGMTSVQVHLYADPVDPDGWEAAIYISQTRADDTVVPRDFEPKYAHWFGAGKTQLEAVTNLAVGLATHIKWEEDHPTPYLKLALQLAELGWRPPRDDAPELEPEPEPKWHEPKWEDGKAAEE